VARLARLALDDDEVGRYAVQLSAILEHVDAVRRLDTADVRRRPTRSRSRTCSAPTSRDRAWTATRCSHRRRWPRAAVSAFPGSWARHRDRDPGARARVLGRDRRVRPHGRAQCRAVLATSLERVRELEGDLHCFNEVTIEAAEADADAVDRIVRSGLDPGPLAGVPVALKDNLCTVGIPTTCSSKILADGCPPTTRRS